MKINLSFIQIFFLIFNGFSNEHEYNAGIVYGSNAAFQISAPYGWILNNRVGLSQGLHCVLYLEFSTWHDSPVVMYAQISGHSNKDEFINYAIEAMAKDSKEFRYEKVLDTLLCNEFKTTVYDYSGLPDKNLNRVAYIQVPSATCYIVFSARYKIDFDKYKKDLNKVLQSFIYRPEYIDFSESQSEETKAQDKNIPQRVLSKAYEISWDRTPNKVKMNPIDEETFLWFGVIDSIRLKSISIDTVEISWYCKYLKLKDPSLDLFNKKYIYYHEANYDEYFFLTYLFLMTKREAIKVTNRYIPGFSYVLVLGEFCQIVKLSKVNAVQIYADKMIILEEQDVRKVK